MTRPWRKVFTRKLLAGAVIGLLGLGVGVGGLGGCQAEQGGYLAGHQAVTALANEPINAKPWNFSTIPGVQITSEHYNVFTTIDDPLYQRMLMKVLEADRARFDKLVPGAKVTSATGGGLECYVFGDRRQWEFFTKKRMPLNAEVYLRISAGGYSESGVFAGYDLGRERTLSVIAHEAWHQYSYFAFKDKLPSFLEEGLATQNETIEWDGATPRFTPEKNLSRYRALREAITGNRLWSLEELSTSHAGQAIKKQGRDVDAYYAQVWSFVLFLKQSPTYRPKFLDMIKRAHEGQLHQVLRGQPLSGNDFARCSERWNTLAGRFYLRAFISSDVPGLEKEYRAYISDLVRSWPPKVKDAEF